jgi:hypothetical protein
LSPRDRPGDPRAGRRGERDREERLGAIRREAAEARRVAGEGVRPAGAPFPAAAARASAETGYYGQPLLKRPVWTWEVPLYFFTGGAAGAAAVIAAAARAAGAGPELARDARWIAALGGAASPALLVSDLGRPERFLNMLRVFKPGSAMSVGAWTLVAFSTASSARAFADLLERRSGGADRSPGRSPGGGRPPVRVLANAAEALSAATGTVMASYTGVLVGATVIPVWNRSVRVLPVHFAASGLASAVALLELLGHRHRALNLLGIAAAAVETAVGAVHETDPDPVYEPLKRGRSGAIVRTGGVLSGPVPLLLRLLGARRAAAVSSLAGSLLTRFGWVEAGKTSADDPSLPLGLE